MLQDLHNEIAIYYLAGTFFVILLIAAIIFYVFLHQKKVNAFRFQLQQEEIKKQEAIFSALQEGEEKERNRIAEELHDGISAKLSGLNMNLDYLRSTVTSDNSGVLDKTYSGINNVINELREISHNLQPIDFNETGLQPLLSNYIEQLNKKKECQYNFYFEMTNAEISNTLKLHCYRIVTELLHNIHKHAKATTASLQLTEVAGLIEVIVEDNGSGFPTDLPISKGIGLTNIRNRVAVCKGHLTIDSSSNGTTVIIELPTKRIYDRT